MSGRLVIMRTHLYYYLYLSLSHCPGTGSSVCVKASKSTGSVLSTDLSDSTDASCDVMFEQIGQLLQQRRDAIVVSWSMNGRFALHRLAHVAYIHTVDLFRSAAVNSHATKGAMSCADLTHNWDEKQRRPG